MDKIRRGLFTLSADPITWGHLDIINRAASVVQQLVVAVMPNPDKPDHLMRPEDQLNLTIKTCKAWCPDNVTVVRAEGLLVDLALTLDCDLIIRGYRNEADRVYEQTQIKYHEMILPDFGQRVLMMEADPKYSHIQSTVVRSFLSNYLPIYQMVPMQVAARLSRKVHRQKFVGVSSGISPEEFENFVSLLSKKLDIPIHEVDLNFLMDPEELCLAKDLGTKLFAEVLEQEKFSATYVAHLSRRFREWLAKDKRGVIFVRGADLLYQQIDSSGWVHNNLIVEASNATLIQLAEQKAAQDKYGTVFQYGGDQEKLAEELASAVKESLI
jgi:pantetheine-phosphate adenylyltransferase